MLTREEATKQLEALRRPKDWIERYKARIDALPEAPRETARLLFAPASEEKRRSQRNKAIESLAKLSNEQILALLVLAFPKLETAIRSAWRLVEQLPYQVGYLRKAFRAPSQPELYEERRRAWASSLLHGHGDYDQDIEWFAAWTPHLEAYGEGAIPLLLAGAIAAGGEEAERVVNILQQQAAGTHDVGAFGRHIPLAFLYSPREDLWEYVEKLLLAAQRQEGLRQAILESIDVAQRGAFRRMLRLILDKDLVRFSSVVRAADVWFGLLWDSASAKQVEHAIETALRYLDDDAAREKALAGDDAEQVYFALWAAGCEDIGPAMEATLEILSHRKADVRFAATHFLSLAQNVEADKRLQQSLDDADLRVAGRAVAHVYGKLASARIWGVSQKDYRLEPAYRGTFEPMEALLARIPEKQAKPKPILFPWMEMDLPRNRVADLLVYLRNDRPLSRVLPHIDDMTSSGRQALAATMAQQVSADADCRATLLRLVGDASTGVREEAVKACKTLKLQPEEAQQLEQFATRKAESLRRAVIALLRSQKDNQVLASANRLLAMKELPARVAGLELLRDLRKSEKLAEAVKDRAKRYRESAKKISRDEQVHLEAILQESPGQALTLENALGLMDPAQLTPITPPVDRKFRLGTPVTAKLIEALDELVHAHRDKTIEVTSYDGSKSQILLGEATYQFPSPNQRFATRGDANAAQKPELPLREVWQNWWEQRPKELRDSDGLEVLRLQWTFSQRVQRYGKPLEWQVELCRRVGIPEVKKPRYAEILDDLVLWLAELYPPKDPWPATVDAFETVVANVPIELTNKRPKRDAWMYCDDWRDSMTNFTGEFRVGDPQWMLEHGGTEAQIRRVLDIFRYLDRPGHNMDRSRAPTPLVLFAHARGWLNDHDVFDHFLGPRKIDTARGSNWRAAELNSISPQNYKKLLKDNPRAAELFMRGVRRLLEIELARGEQETLASAYVVRLTYAGSMPELLQVLGAMGKGTKLARGHFWGVTSGGKGRSFSHLIRATVPDENDTSEKFAAESNRLQLDPEQLLAVAVYAPQWVKHIEKAIGWAGLEEAVWWIHAHTKDRSWTVEQSIREQWNAQIRQRTELSSQDLLEGAVDVAWFGKVQETLGKKRLDEVFELAKYAASGTGHRRAQIFAEAMRGKLAVKATLDQIKAKRTQDLARAVGLIPLDKKNPKADVLRRYKALAEFVRTSNQFGSQRQASEKRAAAIGQENLARSAGYPDPIRLQWAMEAESVADLAKGPVVAKVKDVAVSLAIGPDGLPDLTVARGDKQLASVPAAVKADKAVKTLAERKTELRRTASRMRKSLELAMCRGDVFTGSELRELFANPILVPNLERLVFVGEGILGYPTAGGKALRDHAGKVEPVKPAEKLRIAHPHDLLASTQWTQWQRDCFAAERVQPFKQVFRELYVPTPVEKKDDATRTERYTGQQVNPRQALALLGGRGWVTAPEQGIFRTFHDEGLVAWLEFEEHFHTPAEVEGLTVSAVAFAKRGQWQRTPLKQVPPRVFSEVMRDVDLVVSVAHRGNVDPEASHSTIEMRSALLRETLKLLKLTNVKLTDISAVIKGKLAEYSVHLGSASTHKMPGGALFIVPVHSQHRGRLFLPFADDDPKTAEVISKVLLLARDEEIKDPSLLEQIRS